MRSSPNFAFDIKYLLSHGVKCNMANVLELFYESEAVVWEVFCKKGVPQNFTKFSGNHLCKSLFFNKFLISLFEFRYSFAAQQQTSTSRRQKFYLFYLKFSADFHDFSLEI